MDDDTGEVDFSIGDLLRVQGAIRGQLGLAEERFPLGAFVGMISDEIDQLRAAGWPDGDIAGVIVAQTGKAMTATDLVRAYASPQSRRRPG